MDKRVQGPAARSIGDETIPAAPGLQDGVGFTGSATAEIFPTQPFKASGIIPQSAPLSRSDRRRRGVLPGFNGPLSHGPKLHQLRLYHRPAVSLNHQPGQVSVMKNSAGGDGGAEKSGVVCRSKKTKRMLSDIRELLELTAAEPTARNSAGKAKTADG